MMEEIFEGSLILEKLAELDLLDEFYEAIDSDNIPRAITLMRKAEIDDETIEIAVRKMQNSDGNH